MAVWVTAAERGLGWPRGSFLASHRANREQATELAIHASPLGAVLIAIADEGFQGTATELLDRVRERLDDSNRNGAGWRTPQALSAHLKRLAPDLRAMGYKVDWDRDKAKRTIDLRTARSPASPLSPTPSEERLTYIF